MDQTPALSDARLQNELPGFNWLENKIKNNKLEYQFDSLRKKSPVKQNSKPTENRSPELIPECEEPTRMFNTGAKKELPIHAEYSKPLDANTLAVVSVVVKELVSTVVQAEARCLKSSMLNHARYLS